VPVAIVMSAVVPDGERPKLTVALPSPEPMCEALA
jgi:hypothetical protein